MENSNARQHGIIIWNLPRQINAQIAQIGAIRKNAHKMNIAHRGCPSRACALAYACI
jgi:hypothetical protein